MNDAWVQQQARGVCQPFKKKRGFLDTNVDVLGNPYRELHGSTRLARVRGPRRGRFPNLCGWIDHRSRRAQVGMEVHRLGPEEFQNLRPHGHSHFKDDTLAIDDELQRELQLEHAMACYRAFYFVEGKAEPEAA